MAYVAAHYRSKAIARLIGTAPKTVDAQIANACRKLGVENRADAVRKLREVGVNLDMGEMPLWAPAQWRLPPDLRLMRPSLNRRASPLKIKTEPVDSLDDTLPTMTYRDLLEALSMIASGPRHRSMAPYLVSALKQQGPYLTGRLVMFEILRSANCLADVGPSPRLDG